MWNMLKRARADNPGPDPTPEASELHSTDDVLGRMATPRFQAPELVDPKGHLPPAESLTRLRASRERLLGTVEELASYDLGKLTFPHPFAGPLNAYQWLLITSAHEHRHTEQINRIKSLPDFPDR
jgi:hypothetical protein